MGLLDGLIAAYQGGMGLLAPNDRDVAMRPQIAKGLLGILPGSGDAISGYDAVQSAKQGKYGEAALNGVGLLPFIPSIGGILKHIKTEEQLAEAIRSGEGKYIRWSRGPKLDISRGGSRDYLQGSEHGGFSAVPINPEWATDPKWMSRRVGEYGFLRMKDDKIAPYIYSGEKIGVDSDGYDLISKINGEFKIDPKLVDLMRKKYYE